VIGSLCGKVALYDLNDSDCPKDCSSGEILRFSLHFHPIHGDEYRELDPRMSLVSSHGLWRSRSEGRDFLQSSRPIGSYWNDSLVTLMVRLLRVALCVLQDGSRDCVKGGFFASLRLRTSQKFITLYDFRLF
jgi:hypothetical protein